MFQFDPKIALFTSQHSQIQLQVDENGLWALFAYPVSFNFANVLDSFGNAVLVDFKRGSNFSEDNNNSAATHGLLALQFELPDKVDQELLLLRVMPFPQLDSRRFGSMFVICGVLYGLDSVSQANARIKFALDLFLNRSLPLESEIAFTNPFQSNNFLTYNPAQHKIFGWDHSTLIEYPLLLEVL